MSSSFNWKAAAALASTAAISSATTLFLVSKKRPQSSSAIDAGSSERVIASGDAQKGDANVAPTAMDSPELENRVLRKAETVIQGRTSRVIVVVERCVDDHNYSAIIRTAEALGVQHIWLIDPVVENAELQLDPPEKTPAQELQAAGADSESTERSSKIGVVWHKLEQKWRALLTIGAKTTNLGFFDTEDAAARAYDKAAAQHGLPLNFGPPSTGEEEEGGDGADSNTPLGYAAPHRYEHNMFAKRATEWVTLREFATTAECVEALRLDNRTIWATDLSQHAVCLTQEALEAADDDAAAAASAASGPMHRNAPSNGAPKDVVPERLAVVFGTESVGCTAEILAAADRRVYLPLRGFADSLNLSVSAALVLQQLFHLSPGVVASMPEAERHELRSQWFPKLVAQRIGDKRSTRELAKLTQLLRGAQQAKDKAALHGVSSLTREQHSKLVQEPAWLQQQAALLAKRSAAAAKAAAPSVASPPEPLGDMRRCDEHRTAFVGRNVRNANAAHWQGMPATANEAGKPKQRGVPQAT